MNHTGIMSLKPSETVQKLLLSTTSHFVGEYETEGLLLTHAWPRMHGRMGFLRWEPSPISRGAFVLTFKTEAYTKKAGVVVPNYEPTGDFVCALLSVLFGKRFDSHGPLEMSGMFGLPDITQFGEYCDPRLPHNTHTPRADIGVPLNLVELGRFAPLLEWNDTSDDRAGVFFGASRFYLRALQAAEIDPEVAYLHLITAGEILSNAHGQDPLELLDEEAKAVLERIRAEMKGGSRVANFVRSRLRQIRRRFTASICTYVDQDFFAQREAGHELEALQEDQFEAAIGAAYDLRSRYVHTGVPFGGWIRTGRNNAERQVGRPVVNDPEMAEILALAPTFQGLERVMRYALLRFAETMGADLRLDTQTERAKE